LIDRVRPAKIDKRFIGDLLPGMASTDVVRHEKMLIGASEEADEICPPSKTQLCRVSRDLRTNSNWQCLHLKGERPGRRCDDRAPGAKKGHTNFRTRYLAGIDAIGH
jgi:hypothetical protein